MPNKIYQCCYTNAEKNIGGSTSSGWGTVAVSHDIPPEAYSSCTRLMSVNSTIQNSMLDEQGQSLRLYEISGDGTYLYIAKTQYGLFDRLGRDNMFAHSYIFPCRDCGFIGDVNNYLTVADESFKSSESEALGMTERIVFTEPFELSTALSRCKIGDAAYLKLLQCVYTQFSSRRIAEPLFIQYDGTEENLLSILFCIYSGLPFSVRRRLSAASAFTPNLVSKNLVFSTNAAARRLFVDPKTGENSIMTPRDEHRVSRLGFIGHREQSYYRELEEKAAELGDADASNELVLKLAHQLMTDSTSVSELSDEALASRISDALRTDTLGNECMDSYIAELMREALKRKLTLTEDNEYAFSERVGMSTGLLNEVAEEYDFYRFNALEVGCAAKKLKLMYGSPAFDGYVVRLAGRGSGVKILDRFYSDAFNDFELSWEGLSSAMAGIRYLHLLPDTRERFIAAAEELYTAAIDVGIRPAADAYEYYISLMRRLIPQNRHEECAFNAKKKFWEQLKLTDMGMEPADIKRCKSMRVDIPRCHALTEFTELKVLFAMDYSDSFFSSAFLKTNAYFKKYADVFSEKEAVFGVQRLIDNIRTFYRGNDENFDFWCRALIFADSSETFECIIKICRDIQSRNLQQLSTDYQKLLISPVHSKATISGVSKAVLSAVKAMDSERSPVPLDFWLMLSLERYQNCFEIFDFIEPVIFRLDPAAVAGGSKAIFKPFYFHAAEEYAKRPGESAHIVKKWVSEAKRMKKNSTLTTKQAEEYNLRKAFDAQGRELRRESQEKSGFIKGLFK